jgi:hypothetical protein
MIKFPKAAYAVMLFSGVFALSGCHHQETGANGVSFPAPQAPQSAQAQIQQIQNDPHIPSADKPGIEASIAKHGANPPHQ